MFIGILRILLWAEGLVHKSLDTDQILFLVVAYDWLLFGHQLLSRLKEGSQILYFSFWVLQYLLDEEISLQGTQTNENNILEVKQEHNKEEIEVDENQLEKEKSSWRTGVKFTKGFSHNPSPLSSPRGQSIKNPLHIDISDVFSKDKIFLNSPRRKRAKSERSSPRNHFSINRSVTVNFNRKRKTNFPPAEKIEIDKPVSTSPKEWNVIANSHVLDRDHEDRKEETYPVNSGKFQEIIIDNLEIQEEPLPENGREEEKTSRFHEKEVEGTTVCNEKNVEEKIVFQDMDAEEKTNEKELQKIKKKEKSVQEKEEKQRLKEIKRITEKERKDEKAKNKEKKKEKEEKVKLKPFGAKKEKKSEPIYRKT